MLYNPFRAHVVMREDINGNTSYSVRRRSWFGWQFVSFSWPTKSDGKVSWGYNHRESCETGCIRKAHDLVTRIRTNHYQRQAKEKRRRELGQPISMSELNRMTFQHRLQNVYQPENSNHDLSGFPARRAPGDE